MDTGLMEFGLKGELLKYNRKNNVAHILILKGRNTYVTKFGNHSY